MTEPTHTRDIPAPKYEIVREDAMVEAAGESHQEWLIKTKNKHLIKLLPNVDDEGGFAKYGETSYVSVTHTDKTLPNGKRFRQTSVFGSDADGTFYNAPIYVSAGILEIWQVMFAIGEV